MRKSIGVLILASLLAVACDDDEDDNNKLNDTDRKFITNAGYANHAEIDAGQLATGKASIDGVKMFAAMMATEHTQALTALTTLANEKGASLPNAPDPVHQQLNLHLMDFNGYSFDSAYMRSQITDHIQTIELFENEKANGNDQSVKEYADKYLPHIKLHLFKADSIYNAIAMPQQD